MSMILITAFLVSVVMCGEGVLHFVLEDDGKIENPARKSSFVLTEKAAPVGFRSLF